MCCTGTHSYGRPTTHGRNHGGIRHGPREAVNELVNATWGGALASNKYTKPQALGARPDRRQNERSIKNVENKQRDTEYILDVLDSRFVLAPPGVGFDTFRCYETLLLYVCARGVGGIATAGGSGGASRHEPTYHICVPRTTPPSPPVSSLLQPQRCHSRGPLKRGRDRELALHRSSRGASETVRGCHPQSARGRVEEAHSGTALCVGAAHGTMACRGAPTASEQVVEGIRHAKFMMMRRARAPDDARCSFARARVCTT